MSSIDDGMPTEAKIFMGIFVSVAGLMGFLIVVGIIKTLKNKDKKTDENRETDHIKLETMLMELLMARNQLPGQQVVVAVGEEDSNIEKQTVERFIDLVLEEKPTRFSSQLLQIFTSNYSTKLGQGGYGAVYKGHFPNGQPLAVKVLKSHGIDKRIEGQFMAEVNTIGRTYHKNLVRLYGFCFEPNTKALVYEYMENGSLDKILFEKQHDHHSLEWDKLYEVAIGAARGLEYLHHLSPKRIIHYDIKPANVLLDSNFSPKIADFGLAKLCNRDTTNITMSRVGGTPGYAAPEIYTPLPLSYKCDVYSFGVMLFEIVGRRRNYDVNLGESQEWFPKQIWEKFDKGELEEVLTNCEVEEKDWEKAKTMFKVALWCVQHLPESRPSMREVVKILEGGVETEVAIPPNPFQHLMPSANNVLASSMVSSSNSVTDDEDQTKDTTIMRKYEIQYATFD
ncbi:hypothetical protein CCACVL1_27768 [Corchorus capsularis]|uniref:Protein kinase domain-containing protein n=1 Tax=Corchorus capsularis TaxID=210143 RepID=A0A1R3G8W0_COCAP|nr:hypothetical protein CCACVL1_27768 [Corchorus capsularis]